MTDETRWEAPEAQAAASGTAYGSPERPLPLRQMGIGELIDAAIKLYRRDFLALIGIVAFLVVPVSFLELWLTQSTLGPMAAGVTPTDEEVIRSLGPIGIIFAIELLIVQPFLAAAITRAAADAYLGERVEIGRTYRFALSRLPAILWITILSTVVVILGFVLALVVIVIGAALAGTVDVVGIIVLVLGIILFAIPIVILIRLTLTAPVLVVEDVRGTRALGRSWRLTKGKFWRLLGVLILASLIGGIASLVITIPAQAIVAAIGPEAWPVAAIGTALASVLVTPFTVLIVVLLYFDLRIRKEGYDIEVMAQELGPSS